MPLINELVQLLSSFFEADKRRIDCFAQLILSLITVRTVNLVEIAQGMVRGKTTGARYKRICRFLKHCTFLTFEQLAPFLLKYVLPKGENRLLLMDRTNWKWGKKNINILVVSAVVGSVSIPVVWTFLDKQGSSNSEERIAIIERYIALFGKESIKELLADREFIGEEWFAWLKNEEIPFSIRVKNNFLILNSRGTALVHLKETFKCLRGPTVKVLKAKKKICGMELWLSATRSSEGELVIVASTHAAACALERYAGRWKIETLFGFLKSKGFNFEDTHITDPSRLNNLLFVLTFALCLSCQLGLIGAKFKPIPIKRHGRPAISIFRYGLDALREIILRLHRRVDSWADQIAPLFEVKGCFFRRVFEGI